MNATLGSLEETLLSERGLPGRPWYRHMLYAPGMRTGYGVKTMPGIREAIEEHRFEEAAHYVRVVADALDAYAAALDRAITAH
jgi:N-acetylated-alpha-linked acidic dipeptidase